MASPTPSMFCLVDTVSGECALSGGEMIQETWELLRLIFPSAKQGSGARIQLRTSPIQLDVTVALATDITTVKLRGQRQTTMKWFFSKSVEGLCACGKLITGPNCLSFKERASAHMSFPEPTPQPIPTLHPSGLLLYPPPVAAASPSVACVARCQALQTYELTCEVEDRLRTLVGMLGAAMCGYSDPNLYQTNLSPEAAAAFQRIAEVLLADESMLPLTCFIRPVRPPPPHQPDAALRFANLPGWCKRALGVPFTQWTLAQPWYLQFPASRSHAGVTGADMCLPARRAASRIRSEFPALDAFDSLEYEDQGEAPRVTQEEVVAKVQDLLARTGDFRTPAQATQRLGITLKQLADMVNLKEIGNMAVDMCCSCGVYVLGEQPAVACEHCVDVFHLGCMGLKKVPVGEWICPSCTIASGATGGAAEAAISAASRRSRAPRGEGSRSRNPRGTSGTVRRRNPRGSRSGQPGPAGADPSGSSRPSNGDRRREHRSPGLGDVMPRATTRSGRDLNKEGRNAADAALYATGVPNMPIPGVDGRALCHRISTQMVARRIGPTSNMWRAQNLVNMNMVAGINCEYHHIVNSPHPPVILSEATLVHGGIRCNKCRQAPAILPQPHPPSKEQQQQQQQQEQHPEAGNQQEHTQPPQQQQQEQQQEHLPHQQQPQQGQQVLQQPPGHPHQQPPVPPLSHPIEQQQQQQPPQLQQQLSSDMEQHQQRQQQQDDHDRQALQQQQLLLLQQRHALQQDLLAAQQQQQQQQSEGAAHMLTSEGDAGLRPACEGQQQADHPRVVTSMLGPLSQCSRVFSKLKDFQAHLGMSNTQAPSHIWLPKHRMYLRGDQGTKGLMELAGEEAMRNTALASGLEIAEQAALAARQQALIEGRDPDESDDDIAHMPPPPQRTRSSSGAGTGRSARSRSGGASGGDKRRRGMSEDTEDGGEARPAPPKRSRGYIVPAPPPPPSPEEIKRQQMKAEQIRSLCSSDTKILGQLDSGGQDGMLAAQGEPMEASMQTSALLAIRGGGADGSDLDIDLDDASAALAGVRARAAGEPPCVMKLVQVEGSEKFTLVPMDPAEALQVMQGRLQQQQHQQQGRSAAQPHASSQPTQLPLQGQEHREPAQGSQPLQIGACETAHIGASQPTLMQDAQPAQMESSRPAQMGGSQPTRMGASPAAADDEGTAAEGNLHEAGDGSEGGPRACARVASLKLMRRLSSLADACKEGSTAGGVLQALRACRLAANQIPNVQLQQESMGFIAELLRPLEEQLGVGEQQDQGQANGGGSSNGSMGASSSVKSMEQLLFDVHDLQQQLQEWAGLCH